MTYILVDINRHQAKSIINEELFARITEDDENFIDFQFPEHFQFLGVFHESQGVGFFILEPDNSTSIEVHINILEKYRSEAKEIAQLFLNTVKNSFPDSFQKVNCKVPVIYPDVYHFAKKMGFKDQGLDVKSVRKDGELVDRHLLGICREDI